MQPRLQDQVREAIRVRHYSRRTEKTYWYWIRYYIRFHNMRHPKDMAEADVAAFLTWLATKRNVAAATQNQALNALVFLYKQVLNKPLDQIPDVTRAKNSPKICSFNIEKQCALLTCQDHLIVVTPSLLKAFQPTNLQLKHPHQVQANECQRLHPTIHNLQAELK